MKWLANIGKYYCYVIHDRDIIFQFIRASYTERWYCSNIQESGERTVSKPSAADEAIETLVNAYSSSSTSENAKKQMDDINEMVSISNHVFWHLHVICLRSYMISFLLLTQGGVMIRRNQASFLTKVIVLTRRSFVNMYRDVGYYWLRLGIYISISLCLGTIYNNFGYGYDSIRVSWFDLLLLWHTHKN